MQVYKWVPAKYFCGCPCDGLTSRPGEGGAETPQVASCYRNQDKLLPFVGPVVRVRLCLYVNVGTLVKITPFIERHASKLRLYTVRRKENERNSKKLSITVKLGIKKVDKGKISTVSR